MIAAPHTTHTIHENVTDKIIDRYIETIEWGWLFEKPKVKKKLVKRKKK